MAFALDYFQYPVEIMRFIGGKLGQIRMQQYWQQHGPQLYEEPLYAIRQEWYHTGAWGRRMPSFFARIPETTTLLDYGCGTAEMERLDWIDKGRKTILADVPGPIFDYTKAKYPTVQAVAVNGSFPEGYGALICCHVLEHVAHPIETLRALWDGLTPGGQALLWFDQGFPSPGHLIESIGQYPQYERFLKKQAIRIAATRTYDWVMKPKRRRWWGF
jgi:SAM-dependent methyltransferase